MRELRPLVAGCVALFFLVCCAEEKGLKIQGRASVLARAGKYAEAIAQLERLRVDYKGTIAARDVEKQIAVYRGLLEADQKEKRRRTNEDLIALGRGLQEYRGTTGHFPANLTDLGKANTMSLTDPWGRGYRYQLAAGGARYKLARRGADGAAGGAGDDQDMVVDTGVFTSDIAWEDR